MLNCFSYSMVFFHPRHSLISGCNSNSVPVGGGEAVWAYDGHYPARSKVPSPSPHHNTLHRGCYIENILFFDVDTPENQNKLKREQLLALNFSSTSTHTRYIPTPTKLALELLFRKKQNYHVNFDQDSRHFQMALPRYLKNECQKSTCNIVLTFSDVEFATLHFQQPFDVAMIKEQIEETTGVHTIPGSSFHYSFIHGYTYFSLFLINFHLITSDKSGINHPQTGWWLARSRRWGRRRSCSSLMGSSTGAQH